MSSNQEAIDEVLDAGPKSYEYPRGDKPVMTLIRELAGRNEAAYIHIKKGDFSITPGIAGRNLPIDQRLAPLELKPELASFDAGSINLGGGVFSNPPEFLDAAAKMMLAKGVKPEIEIFDFGMIVTALRMRDEGKLEDPLHFQFVLGTPWGAPATPKSLLYLHEHIPHNATWSVIGIGKGHLPMSMMGLLMGGHVRVGM